MSFILDFAFIFAATVPSAQVIIDRFGRDQAEQGLAGVNRR